MSDLSQVEGILTVISTVLSLFVTWTCICAVNNMSRKTRFLNRLAYVLLGTGAIGVAMYPFWFQKPIEAHVLILLAAIALIAFDKWRLQKRSMTRHHRIL